MPGTAKGNEMVENLQTGWHQCNLRILKMKFKKWLIMKLGGVTTDFHEETRVRYERWAVEHLTGKNGEVTPVCAHYFPFDGDDIVVISSSIRISNAKIKGLKVAPWCRNVALSGLTGSPWWK